MSQGYWTENRVETLKAMWADNTTKAIADAIGAGCNRNMVIGKGRRLGLPKKKRGPVYSHGVGGLRDLATGL